MRHVGWIAAAALVVSGCGDEREAAEDRQTVFDPLVETLDRAESVQQEIDARAAEQRRRIEEAE